MRHGRASHHGPRLALLFAALLVPCIGSGGCREQVDEDTLTAGTHRGRVLYLHHCSACHGLDGRGQPTPAPDGEVIIPRNLSDPKFQAERSDAQVLAAIRQGVPPGMPAFDQVLTPEQILDVAIHVRKLGDANSTIRSP